MILIVVDARVDDGCGMGGGARVGRDGLGRGKWDHVGPNCGGQVDQRERVGTRCIGRSTHCGVLSRGVYGDEVAAVALAVRLGTCPGAQSNFDGQCAERGECWQRR